MVQTFGFSLLPATPLSSSEEGTELRAPTLKSERLLVTLCKSLYMLGEFLDADAVQDFCESLLHGTVLGDLATGLAHTVGFVHGFILRQDT